MPQSGEMGPNLPETGRIQNGGEAVPAAEARGLPARLSTRKDSRGSPDARRSAGRFRSAAAPTEEPAELRAPGGNWPRTNKNAENGERNADEAGKKERRHCETVRYRFSAFNSQNSKIQTEDLPVPVGKRNWARELPAVRGAAPENVERESLAVLCCKL